MASPRGQRVGAYVVCVDAESRLLLCRLAAITGRPGWWTLPGGGVDYSEHPADAAVRELREETGYEGRVTDLLAVDSVAGPVTYGEGIEIDVHRIRIVYRGEITGGHLTVEADGSTDDARWFDRDELETVDVMELGRLGARLAWETT